MRKPSKYQIAKKIMLQNRKMPYDAVFAEMQRRGAETTRASLSVFRARIKKEGYDLPNLKRGTQARLFVRLNGKRAAIMKQLYETPRASSKEIQEMLANQRKIVPLSAVWQCRGLMRRWFPEMDFSPKLKSLELTEAQQQMIPGFKKTINWALFKEIFPKLNWPYQRKEDFRAFVMGEIPRLIKNYEPTKSSLAHYIINRLGFRKRDFTRQDFGRGMGLKRRDVDLLVRIIREDPKREKDAGEIAAKLGCSGQEVKDLRKAYSSFQRTQERLGWQKEQ